MEAFQESTYYPHVNDNQQITPEKHHLLTDTKSDHFVVDDLLVFPTDDVAVEEEDAYVADTSTESSAAVDSCNSSATGDEVCRSFVDTQLPNLYVPHDDIAEFEWLSNFMEESFSSEDLQKLQLISGIKTPSKYSYETIKGTNNDLMFNIDMTIPGKARTKRSRAVSCNWASQLLVKSPSAEISSNSESNIAQNSIGKKKLKTKEFDDKSCRNDDGRKCVHCATDKTPQWRSGPMGPKTLCNACGVRYKSGRLVPEYRPAASPTFVLTKHSNSHRKVLELQRQKSQHHHQQRFLNHQNDMLRPPNHDDYSIHQPMSHDYWQLI